ncbi:SDR family oxidoreductase [Catenulispora subtropica]|uniref:SDR family oxidoreductase n=1 Tax=Catenulispora subtropica TaxID=450798 RepID=A0ABN2RUZ8_9ACTN
MTSFTGRVAVVTGGTRGIGRAVAARFEAAGATVVTLARTEPRQAVGRFIATDLGSHGAVRDAFRTVAEEFGRVDVLVNNAGGARPGAALDYSEAAARAAFDLNVLGALFAAQCMYPLTPEHGGASIVNIGSVAGTRPSPGTALYGAAKAALASLTKSLALEWAPRVRVNCVLPGPVLTESLTAYYGGPEAAAVVGQGLPMGRMAEPADIADACLFLASDAARQVSGAELLVHGGGEAPRFNRAGHLPRRAAGIDGTGE